MNIIKTKSQALAYLEQYIPKDKEFKFPGELGLERTSYLLKLLGEPQNKLKVIHIAGTSGKGSTSYLISVILRSLGLKVGLCVSPILIDTRERFQINNKLISNKEFYINLNKVVAAVGKVTKTKYGAPTYYEILVALTYYIFNKEQVDYAVIETGLGGLLDGTNVVTREDKVAVITQIGHDHTAILGKTLDKIAFQKAGIIHHHNIVITLKQQPKVVQVIQKKAIEQEAKLHVIGKENIKNSSLVPMPKFDFHYLNKNVNDIELQMMGSFQIQNCSLALTTTLVLSQRDGFEFDQEKIRRAIKNAVFLGRMQQMDINNQTLIIDGAHNPQKMHMLAKNLVSYFPHQQFVFMMSLRRGKNYKEILRQIIPLAKKIIVAPFEDQTKAQGFSALAEDTKILAKIFESLHFKNYMLRKNSHEALHDLLADKKSIGVITGSLYLLSEVYPVLLKKRTSQVRV